MISNVGDHCPVIGVSCQLAECLGPECGGGIALKGFQPANFPADFCGAGEDCRIGGEGDMREGVFQVFGKLVGIALRGEQAEDGIKNVLRRLRTTIGFGERGDEDGVEVMRVWPCAAGGRRLRSLGGFC